VSLGLAPVAVDAVYRSLETLIATGATIVLVEQDLARAMSIADRLICMLEGSFVLEGKAADLTREQITEAYFGLGAGRRAGNSDRPGDRDRPGNGDGGGNGDRQGGPR
jgi:branched-chain amino acid transport system ATP-binding protein